jgi:ankyrin repeat protein
MKQLSRQLKAKKADKWLDLAKNKLPTEKRALDEEGQRQIDDNFLRAVAYDNLDAAKRLLKNGANIEVRDDNGWTALIYAANTGHVEMCLFLIKEGANANAKDDNGFNAFMHAESKANIHRNTRIAKFLKLCEIRDMVGEKGARKFLSGFSECIKI